MFVIKKYYLAALVYAFCFIRISDLYALSLAEIHTTKLKITLSTTEISSKFQLKVSSVDGTQMMLPEPIVSAIENPSRFVVDIPGFPVKVSQNVTLRNDMLASIRLGVHQDKTRVVVDIRNNEQVKFAIRSDNSGAGAIVIDLEVAVKTTVISQPKSPNSTKVEPVKAVPVTNNTSSEVKLTETIIPVPKEPEIATAVITAPKVAVDGATGAVSVLNSISFSMTNNTNLPAVVFEIDNIKSYSLSKRRAELYELSLSSAKLVGSELTQPHFPSENFRGFAAVVAREENDGVIVKIYVEPGVKLFPYIAKNKLWLKASH